MPSRQRPNRTGERPLECAHCQYPIPGEATTEDDQFYCSRTCHEAAADGATVPDPGAYKRTVTGVEPLDALLPDGVPTNSFVRITGEAGTRRTELLTELAWRALERHEPAVVVGTATPPTAILEQFFENGWNVLPALEDDRLRIVDCFTNQLTDPETVRERRNEWLSFVGEAASDAVDAIETPDDPDAVRTAVVEALDALGMTETGVVTVESLAALDSRFGIDGVSEWCAELRAAVPKAQYVPVFVGTAAGEVDERRTVFDGIVDLRMVDRLETETRRRQLAVDTLTGARHLPQWVTYEYEPVRGLYAPGSTEDGRNRRATPPHRRREQ